MGPVASADSKIFKISERALDLHRRSLVIDTHVDTALRLASPAFQFDQRHADGSVDLPRLREGGIGAVFFAVYIPGTVRGETAVAAALKRIESIRALAMKYPNDLAFAASASGIERARAEGKIAILIAVEGGHMMNCDLEVLRQFAALGARYMTLTHNVTTEWADSATDTPLHGGLSEFGKTAIREMNRLGMMVDISHVSDKAFADVLATSDAPVIASHSSCRALCDSPRNLTDEMMRALAAKSGVVQINFHAGFVSQAFRNAEKAQPGMHDEIDRRIAAEAGEGASERIVIADRIVREFVAEGRLPRVDWTEVIDHVDHAVKVAGEHHVGLGSDFDGADMPYGLEDAACFPRITGALLERGYSEQTVGKILGRNTLRLMHDVESVAATRREKRA